MVALQDSCSAFAGKKTEEGILWYLSSGNVRGPRRAIPSSLTCDDNVHTRHESSIFKK